MLNEIEINLKNLGQEIVEDLHINEVHISEDESYQNNQMEIKIPKEK